MLENQITTIKNCEHLESGWCLICVLELLNKLRALEKAVEDLKKCLPL